MSGTGGQNQLAYQIFPWIDIKLSNFNIYHMTYSVSIEKEAGGKLNLVSNFSEPITLESSGQEAIISINNVSSLMTLNTLETVYTGNNNTRQLKMYFRMAISSDPTKWSEWEELNPNGESECFPDVTPFYDYNIQIKFVRIGGSDTGEINIESFDWEGVWNANQIDEAIIDLPPNSDIVIFDVPDVYKVFRLDGYELVAKGVANLEMKYRISQNNKRTWTEWTPLTNDNLKTEKIDPIRFFNMQYSLHNIGSTGTVQIRDLNIYGSFINITQNYSTSNLFGLREDCKNGAVGDTGLGANDLNMSSGLETEPSIWSNMTCDVDGLFNPYKLDEAIGLYDKLSNDATAIGGWSVDYFRTDPDGNGIDHTLHEYTLKNIVDHKDVKIMVPDNQFPNGQMAFNQYDLYAIDSFEVHLTKQEFKKVFGAQYRPRVDDFFYFCDISKVYEVQNAQALRSFGNAEVYYKIILKKYNQDASRQAANTDIAAAINNIAQNSTFEDLFNTRMDSDKKEVAFKKQHDTLTKDRIRGKIFATVDKGLIENAELILSKYHYNLTGIDVGNDAVIYQDADRYLQAGKNRSFISWFKFKDYADIDVYNLLNNYNSELNKGYKFDIDNGLLTTTINNDTYSMDISDHLNDEVWYCVLVNINQRQEKITHYLYKRNVNREIDAGRLNSTKLKLLASETSDYIVNEYELDDNELIMKITASNMLITNLRIYDDVIPEEQHTKILNQQIVRDTDHAILADNANKVMILPNFPLA